MAKKADWIDICHLNDIQVGTGVCALVNQEHVAIFRPYADEQVFAISNIDPFALASVLSRGLICEHQGELWVVSPLKKQRFNLATGRCLEDEQNNIASFKTKVQDQRILICA